MSKVSDFFAQRKRGVRGKSAGKPALAPAPAVEEAVAAPVPSFRPVAADSLSAGDHDALKQFDLCSKYGPCSGMTRLERWERAEALGLQPPPSVRNLLLAAGVDSAANNNIWHNRV